MIEGCTWRGGGSGAASASCGGAGAGGAASLATAAARQPRVEIGHQLVDPGRGLALRVLDLLDPPGELPQHLLQPRQPDLERGGAQRRVLRLGEPDLAELGLEPARSRTRSEAGSAACAGPAASARNARVSTRHITAGPRSAGRLSWWR